MREKSARSCITVGIHTRTVCTGKILRSVPTTGGRTGSGEQDKEAGGPYSWQRLGHDHRLSTEKPNRVWEIANMENWWLSKISSCENGRESENRIRLGCGRL